MKLGAATCRPMLACNDALSTPEGGLLVRLADGRAGQPGEQWTMFFTDDSGNALEFKAMTNPENLFAKYVVE